MRPAVVCITIAVLALLPMTATGQPFIGIHTDASTYQPGETIEVSLSALNEGEGMSVDVYVGLITPGWEIYAFGPGGWTSSLEPWIADIYVPAGFSLPRTPLWWIDLPCSMPPIIEEGGYNFAAVLTLPGKLEWVSDLSLAPFHATGGSAQGITMISIPAGSFAMGSPEEEEGRAADESPLHTLSISGFKISETEITQRQWEDAMGWNDSENPGDDLPVENVTWCDCVDFCNKLSEEEGLTTCYTIRYPQYDGSGKHIVSAEVACARRVDGYRLPTEAEWEYACRAGTTTRFYTGDSETDLDQAGWYIMNSEYQTHSVGQKAPNALGLYDMHGNVTEWCWDGYDGLYYAVSYSTDPEGPVSSIYRVHRGGCYSVSEASCRSAARGRSSPGSHTGAIGLRVCRSEGWTPRSDEITMIAISGGSFQMGSPESEEGRYDDEGPVHTVSISPFFISETEITQRQWLEVMGWNETNHGGEHHPVQYLNRYDAVSFCNELSESEGLAKCYTLSNVYYHYNHIFYAEVEWDDGGDGYRLPTEAEWEYACRAGTTTRFFTGDEDADLGYAGWYLGNTAGGTHPVGQKLPNALGLYDTHGNAIEWCWDWHGYDYYGSSPASDPKGPDTGIYRIMRGGITGEPRHSRSARRHGQRPEVEYNGPPGLRVARSWLPSASSEKHKR